MHLVIACSQLPLLQFHVLDEEQLLLPAFLYFFNLWEHRADAFSTGVFRTHLTQIMTFVASRTNIFRELSCVKSFVDCLDKK